VRAEDRHAVRLDYISHLEERGPHGYVQLAGFAGPRNYAAVVIREHDGRAVPQLGVEHTLTAHVELIRLNQGYGRAYLRCLSVPVDRIHDPAPDLEVHPLGHLNWKVRRVL